MLFIWHIHKSIKPMKYLFISILMMMTLLVLGQGDIIEPIESGLSFLDDSAIKHIRIVSADVERMLVEVELYDKTDKRFVFTGQLLDRAKSAQEIFQCEPQEISKGSSTVDLMFTVSSNNRSTSPNITSDYIKIKMIEKDEDDDSIFDDLENLFGGDDPLTDIFSKQFIFKYEKEWRLKGNDNMVITIPLTPLGQARNLN